MKKRMMIFTLLMLCMFCTAGMAEGYGDQTIYTDILTAYADAVAQQWDRGVLAEKGLNHMVASCYGDGSAEAIGYLVTDLDGDGLPELLIGTTENVTDDFYKKLVFALYSLELDGTATPVFSSMERDRYYYGGDGLFAHVGSGGAADSFDTTVQWQGRTLTDLGRTTAAEDYVQLELFPMSRWEQPSADAAGL